MSNSKKATISLGIVFSIVGLLGFIPNPLVHSTGIFVTNAMHNAVHILTGMVLLLAINYPGSESNFIRSVGFFYAAVSALGFITNNDYILEIILINEADRWLHVALAIAMLVVAKVTKSTDEKVLTKSS